jgi:hypothetical protein
MFDTQIIQSLKKSAGPKVLSMALLAFISDCQSSRASLEEALERDDEILARRTGHKLNGLFMQYGCTGSDLAKRLSTGADEDWRELSRILVDLCERLEPEAGRLAQENT